MRRQSLEKASNFPDPCGKTSSSTRTPVEGCGLRNASATPSPTSCPVPEGLGTQVRPFPSTELFRACFCPLALLQIVAGVKYIMEVEIGRTTCPKPAADLQSCAFHDAPQMAKHTVCKFVVYTVPWLNQIKLLTADCQ
uniref:Egg-white cystatin n=1 Tax=Athene cunicularia TaxID=194338 RepID=A0A663MN21_ATHCN